MVAAGPAMENISFPAAAIGLAPNTGEATKMAPFWLRRSEHLAHVSGWTVDVSIQTLPSSVIPASSAFVTSPSNTSSFEI